MTRAFRSQDLAQSGIKIQQFSQVQMPQRVPLLKRLSLLFVLMLSLGISAFAQNTHTVTGKVTDEKGQGYPGAGITLKGSHTGTVSDINGDFMLDVPDGANVFIIQAVGYQTVEARENEQAVNVKLQAKSKELEGTVVTALAFNREKRELGYATTTLNNEDLTYGQNSSALSDLQGKVAGANITSSTGGPGGSTRIVLRGEKSILKSNNALIIVDGVITNNFDRTQSNPLSQIDFGNSANDLNPEDIESVTILEGPAAAALYGAAAANGAVIYTTKKGSHNTSGKKTKMDVTFKTTYTQSDILKYPDMQSQFGQGSIYVGPLDDRGDNFSWGPAFDGQLRPWGQVIDGKQQVKPYSAEPNNLKQFYNHGRDMDNFVSISGGDEISTYYLSISSLNNEGVVPNTFYNKYNVRFNGTTQLSNNFYSSITVNYINTYSRVEQSGQLNGGVMQALLQIPTDIPISQLRDLNSKFNSMDFVDANGINRYGYFGAFSANPFWLAKYYDNRDKTSRMIGDFKVGYKKGDFDVFERVGIDATDDNTYIKTPQSNSTAADPSIYYPEAPFQNNGGYAQTNYTGVRAYSDLIGTYTHALSENFGMMALVGNNVTINRDEVLSATIDNVANGLVIPNFYNFTNNQGPVLAANTATDHRTYAMYADVKFNFQRELYLDLTGRNEWSSTLTQGQNSYFYPGANAAWVFTERMHGNFKDKVLDYGKFRIGTAGVSSDAVPYANNPAGYTQATIATGFGKIQPPFNSQPAYSITNSFGNSSLKPELTREYEMGFDLSFLKDRIVSSFTYYNDLTHNLITAIPVAPSTGYLFEYTNVGDISNKGVEVSLRGTPISTKYGLKWDLFGTYTHNVNDVVSLNGNVTQLPVGSTFQGMDIVAAVGHPYGTFYASDITYWNGHPVVDPTTGLPVPTSKPVLRGSFLPKFEASWGTEVSYKGLKLHALFATKQGGQFYSQNKNLLEFTGAATETTVNGRNPYVWANSVYQVGTTNNYLRNTTKFSPYNYYANEVGQNQLPAQDLVDASYIKLQELSLSYKIPQKYYKNTIFGSLEAGLFGNNLILWTPKSNKYDDPEEFSSGAIGNAQGFNYSARPTTRNYGAFIKVTF